MLSFGSFSFSLKSPAVEDISQVKLRQIFPFLWKDKVEGFAKQAVRKQEKPQLLNSYQGHKKSITGLIFRERNQVLISASSDKSVRLWHLSGQVREFKFSLAVVIKIFFSTL